MQYINEMPTDDYFCKEFRVVSLDAKTATQTMQDVQFVEEMCQLGSGSQILDLGCGAGRHSIDLAKRGYQVVGYDNNNRYLQTAQERAEREGIHVNWVLGEAQDLAYDEQFDAIISLFTSFGYDSDEGNILILRKISRALKPGGHFILEMTNRDIVAAVGKITKVIRVDNLVVIKENSFDPRTSRRLLDWTYIIDDKVVFRTKFDHRLYSLHELLNMFQEVGLETRSIFQDTKGTPFKIGASKIALVAQKPWGTSAGTISPKGFIT